MLASPMVTKHPPGKIHQNLMIPSANLDRNACNVGGRDTAWFWGRSRDRYCWMASAGHLAIWEWSAQRTLEDSMAMWFLCFWLWDWTNPKIIHDHSFLGPENGRYMVKWPSNHQGKWWSTMKFDCLCTGHFLTRPGGKFWRLLRCAADVTRTVGPQGPNANTTAIGTTHTTPTCPQGIVPAVGHHFRVQCLTSSDKHSANFTIFGQQSLLASSARIFFALQF